MEMRDQFAIQIMQAFIKNTAHLGPDNEFNFEDAISQHGVSSELSIGGVDGDSDKKYTWAQLLAEEAYAVADAMIKARTVK